MHPLPVRVVIPTRRKRPLAELTGKPLHSGVLNLVIQQRILQLEGPPTNVALKRLQVRMLNPHVVP